MPGLTSSIPAAVDALIADLTTMAAESQAAFPQLTVFDGELTRFEPTNWIVVGDITDATQRPASMGNRRRDESYVINCMLQVLDQSDITTNAKAARDKAFTLLELVVTQLNFDPTLGGAVRFCQLTHNNYSVAPSNDGGGVIAQIDFGITCDVTIQLS
jgi:hypothetical protein